MGSINVKGAIIGEPDCPDDEYRARLVAVGTPYTGKNFSGEDCTKVDIDFELLPTAEQQEAGCPLGYTRRMWPRLTESWLKYRRVHPKSTLHDILAALSREDGTPLYDLDSPQQLDVDSDHWVGCYVRVAITHSETSDRPTISKVLPLQPKARLAKGHRPIR